MRHQHLRLIGGVMIVFAYSAMLSAQRTRPPNAGTTPPPGDARDLSGVWNSRPPASARAYINSTFSRDEPALTAWAEAKYRATKPSNGPRTYPLEETNDPVLTSCLPPG